MDPFPPGNNPYSDLVNAWLSRFPANVSPSSRILVVNADASPEKLGVLEHGNLVAEYLVSTARNGMGDENGSDETPLGWHAICGRIGDGCAPGTAFGMERRSTSTVSSLCCGCW